MNNTLDINDYALRLYQPKSAPLNYMLYHSTLGYNLPISQDFSLYNSDNRFEIIKLHIRLFCHKYYSGQANFTKSEDDVLINQFCELHPIARDIFIRLMFEIPVNYNSQNVASNSGQNLTQMPRDYTHSNFFKFIEFLELTLVDYTAIKSKLLQYIEHNRADMAFISHHLVVKIHMDPSYFMHLYLPDLSQIQAEFEENKLVEITDAEFKARSKLIINLDNYEINFEDLSEELRREYYEIKATQPDNLNSFLAKISAGIEKKNDERKVKESEMDENLHTYCLLTGVDPKAQTAEKIRSFTARPNCPYARHALAYCTLYGIGTNPDIKKAFDMFSANIIGIEYTDVRGKSTIRQTTYSESAHYLNILNFLRANIRTEADKKELASLAKTNEYNNWVLNGYLPSFCSFLSFENNITADVCLKLCETYDLVNIKLFYAMFLISQLIDIHCKKFINQRNTEEEEAYRSAFQNLFNREATAENMETDNVADDANNVAAEIPHISSAAAEAEQKNQSEHIKQIEKDLIAVATELWEKYKYFPALCVLSSYYRLTLIWSDKGVGRIATKTDLLYAEYYLKLYDTIQGSRKFKFTHAFNKVFDVVMNIFYP